MTKEERLLIRQCYFLESTSDQAIHACMAWLKETGGTVITNTKGTFQESFDLDTEKRYKDFESSCAQYGVRMGVIRGRKYRLTGKRLLLLYPNDNEIAEVEHNLESYGAPEELESIRVLVWNHNWVKNWIIRYQPELMGNVPESIIDLNDAANTEAELPADIVSILEYLAACAKGYGNNLKWDEEAKLKSDLMLNWEHWKNVDVSQVRLKCAGLGMSIIDVKTIVNLINKRKSGHKLVPDGSYRGFEFKH